MEKTIIGKIISLQDQENGVQIILDTTVGEKKSQLQIVTTRHEDLQELRRGNKIKIVITDEP